MIEPSRIEFMKGGNTTVGSSSVSLRHGFYSGSGAAPNSQPPSNVYS
jgi:hypothetical protein